MELAVFAEVGWVAEVLWLEVGYLANLNRKGEEVFLV